MKVVDGPAFRVVRKDDFRVLTEDDPAPSWYSTTIKTTIDNGGRVVIPKTIREEAGLSAGTEVDIQFREGRIEIEPVAVPMHLAKRAGGATIEIDAEVPELTIEQVRDTLERVRR